MNWKEQLSKLWKKEQEQLSEIKNTVNESEESEALQNNAEAQSQDAFNLYKIEKKEFEQLVAEIKPLGFTHSNQISSHIIRNKRLGYKYKHISGIVKMEQDGISWNYEGGFPKMIYAKLCQELGLINQGTRARAVGFKPFKDL